MVAREILDSRGIPTVACRVTLASGGAEHIKTGSLSRSVKYNRLLAIEEES